MSIPAYPWQQRPDDYPLTNDEVCTALAEAGGNPTEAAARLKVGSLVLRKFVERSARAKAVIQEMKSRRCDRAASLLGDALDSPDDRRADWAIRYVLNSKNARNLGWGSVESSDDLTRMNGPLINLVAQPVEWQDGTKFTVKEVARQIIDLTPAPDKSSSG